MDLHSGDVCCDHAGNLFICTSWALAGHLSGKLVARCHAGICRCRHFCNQGGTEARTDSGLTDLRDGDDGAPVYHLGFH
jgi:hypothetical protein